MFGMLGRGAGMPACTFPCSIVGVTAGHIETNQGNLLERME
jgi:hypothetical protein